MERLVSIPYNIYETNTGRIVGLDAHVWALIPLHRRILLVKSLDQLEDKPRGVQLKVLVTPQQQVRDIEELARRIPSTPGRLPRSARARMLAARIAAIFFPYKLIERSEEEALRPLYQGREEALAISLARQLRDMEPRPTGRVAWLNLGVHRGVIVDHRGRMDRVYNFLYKTEERFKSLIDSYLQS